MVIQIEGDIELKQLDTADAADIFNIIDTQREYLGKWLPFVEYTKDLSNTIEFVDSVVNAPKDRFEYVFAIRNQNEFAGIIGFKDTDRFNKKTEIGYWLSEKHQKRGIMTKAVKKLCEFAFYDQGLNRVQIKCAVGNKASRNIPQRLGFQFEGIERQGEILTGNVFTDLEIYSKLKEDK